MDQIGIEAGNLVLPIIRTSNNSFVRDSRVGVVQNKRNGLPHLSPRVVSDHSGHYSTINRESYRAPVTMDDLLSEESMARQRYTQIDKKSQQAQQWLVTLGINSELDLLAKKKFQ